MTGKFITAILAIWLTILTGLGINHTGVTLVKPADNTQFKASGDWKLTFEDNFDGDTFDHTKWHYGYKEEGVRRGGYWVDDAVSVKDGNLIIKTDYRKDGKFGAGWYTGAIETSKSSYDDKTEAEINKDYKGFSGKYGYYEVRCKVPKAIGIWSAFWLMPDNNFKNDTFGTGKDGAEIDVFESPYLSAKTYKESVAHAVHIDGYGEKLKSSGSDMQFVKGLYDEFHTFALEWNETEYIFYVDGMQTWKNSKTVKPKDVDKSGNPYDTVAEVMEYMILSVEVGGSTIDGVVTPGKVLDENKQQVTFWSGDASLNDTEKSYDFIVDYVKVYQK
ncbi:MAG: glycoside hydrolase family 16 protein [Oscillospiraceae bacterium]